MSKNRIKLTPEFVVYLSNQPENGIGYHIVDITLRNGIILVNRIVLNSEFLVLNLPSEIKLNDIKKIEVKQN